MDAILAGLGLVFVGVLAGLAIGGATIVVCWAVEVLWRLLNNTLR